MIVVGTNDEFLALGAPNGMMKELEGDTAFLYIDNLPHTWVSLKHLAAWKMWLSHLFHGRQLPSVKTWFKQKDHLLTVSARVSAPNKLSRVRLYYSYNTSLDWRLARWESMPMELENGEYGAVLEKKADYHLAFYVEVEDFHEKGGPGYLSSLVQIIRNQPVAFEKASH